MLQDKCPHCGGTSGLYVDSYVSGKTRYYIGHKGELQDNSYMYEYVNHEQNKWYRCQDCDKRVIRVEDHEKLILDYKSGQTGVINLDGVRFKWN